MVVKSSKAEKNAVTVDLYRPLPNYIVFNYSEREAQDVKDDLQTLKQLRSDLECEPRLSLSSVKILTGATSPLMRPSSAEAVVAEGSPVVVDVTDVDDGTNVDDVDHGPNV
ncbi:Vacuolar-sorting protein BRO1 [Camellia lanceoleosa]|uniref:Vacuolar-sorting protein BRO1 n=1 Tax=Camellia lanceoleosa TaxID=1840588 RepID=A0ACC0I9A1_9ERIC|nr:Vacuolar-sorting protein BRO1 [Camellia lanceoleosa]